MPHTPQAPILISAAFFGTSGHGTVRITGGAPGPSKVATRIWDWGKGVLLLIPPPQGEGGRKRKRADGWGKRKFSDPTRRPSATTLPLRGRDHCPQALNASAKARSPGVPFSIARIARRPLL